MGKDSQIDKTGRSKLIKNVITSWLAYLIYFIAGFITPRLISDAYGIETLGVWDLSWSIVAYYGLVQFGISASIDRYVAKYYSVDDHDGLNKSISTMWLFQVSASILTIIAVYLVYHYLPLFSNNINNELIEEARILAIFLGFSITISMLFTPYTGIINGLHYWNIHNLLSTVMYATSIACMYIAIWLGAKIHILGIIYFIVELINQLIRFVLAHKLYPRLEISIKNMSFDVFKDQATFGSKTLIPRIAELLVNQTASILIALKLGPVALAIYSRPKSLVRHMKTFITKFTNVMVPTISALKERGDEKEINNLINKSVYYTNSLALTFIFTMLLSGDLIIGLWMGSEYAYYALIAVISIGAFISLMYEPIWSICVGLNIHGKIALMKMLSAIAAIMCLLFSVYVLRSDVLGAAVSIYIPMLLIEGIYLTAFLKNYLNVSIMKFIRSTIIKPFIYLLPYTTILLLFRLIFDVKDLLIPYTILSFTLLFISYWFFILPDHIKNKFVKMIFRHFKP